MKFACATHLLPSLKPGRDDDNFELDISDTSIHIFENLKTHLATGQKYVPIAQGQEEAGT